MSKPPPGPPLGPDGKPLGPPLDKDGKPFPPPPIIGPDGKEIPRPTDEHGNPLPIYVTKDGKPILDENNKAIPLKFDKDGKPIPLEGGPGPGPGPPGPNEGRTATNPVKNVPKWALWVAIVDIVFTLITLAIVSIVLGKTEAKKEEDDDVGSESTTKNGPTWYLVGSIIVAIVGIIATGLPIVASKKNREDMLKIWCCVCFVLLLVAGVLIYFAYNFGTIASLANSFMRLVMAAIVTACIYCAGQSQGYNPGYNLPQGAYPGQGRQVPQVPAGQNSSAMMLLQQDDVVLGAPMYTPSYAMMPSYGYPSYGFGGYPTSYGYGMGMGYGYGMGMGMAYGAGTGMYGASYGSYPYYGYGWGWSGGMDGWW